MNRRCHGPPNFFEIFLIYILKILKFFENFKLYAMCIWN